MKKEFKRHNEKFISIYRDLWIENLIKNMKHIRRFLKSPVLLKPFRNYIICGAGPGLDTVIGQLAKVKHEKLAGICAVDASYLPLRKAGINPDIMVSIDMDKNTIPQMLSYKPSSAPLAVFACTSSWKAVQQWKGKKAFVALGGAREELMEEFSILGKFYPCEEVGFVTGTAAIILNKLLHSLLNSIAFVGNDLSYPIVDGLCRRYCKNMWNADDEASMIIKDVDAYRVPISKTKLIKVSDTRHTEESFILYAKALGTYLRVHNPCTFYNATPSIMDDFAFDSSKKHLRTNLISTDLETWLSGLKNNANPV